MKNKLTLFLLCATAIIASCQSKQEKLKSKQMEQKFEWTPGVGAANLYPMELYKCGFVYADGDGVRPATPNLTVGTWGKENGKSGVGDVMKPIPVELDISWLSYTENKFYKGSFKLPYEKMLKLFQKGYERVVLEDGKGKILIKNYYNNILAGLAPGGVVVVWISGGGSTVDVGRFQAVETKVDMKDFIQRTDITITKDAYVKEELARDSDVTDNLAKNGIPFGLWDKYRERFNQQTVVKFDQSHPVENGGFHLSYYNGEGESIYDEKYQKNDFRPRAMVKDMNLVWTDTNAGKPQGYFLGIKFDEAEMFRAYKEAYGDKPQQEGQLVVEINRGNDRYKAFLQVGDKKIELIKQQGEIMFDNTNK